MDTLGSIKGEIRDWLDEDLPDSRLNSAVNDGIGSLWLSLMKASMSLFLGGPIDLHFTTSSNILITVFDPTTAPTVSDTPALDTGKAAHTIRAGVTYVTESGSETLMSPITT